MSELLVATLSLVHPGFLVEGFCQMFLNPSPFANVPPIRVVVDANFRRDKRPGTTQFVVVADPDDGFFLGGQFFHGLMPRLHFPLVSSTYRRVTHLSNGNLKAVIHLELFIRVERIRHPGEHCIDARTPLSPLTHP